LVPVEPRRSQVIFVGVDWAEAHHDVHVQDEDGRRLAGGRLPEGVDGVARFHDLVGGHAVEPAEVVVGIETDRCGAALVAAGYLVFAVNPMSTSRYRDRHSTSGAKSDPGDAKVWADMSRAPRADCRRTRWLVKGVCPGVDKNLEKLGAATYDRPAGTRRCVDDGGCSSSQHRRR